MNPEFRVQNSELSRANAQLNSRPRAARFQDLILWQKAHEFVLMSYRYSENFPRQEIYGLTSQLRRAAVSIAANIAEGFKKRGKSDKTRFLNISFCILNSLF